MIGDHAKAIDLVQEKGRLFETYNVGGHNEQQNIEIIRIMGFLFCVIHLFVVFLIVTAGYVLHPVLME